MELRALHYFLAIAREENMTEAANVLHVTQPTLSRQMADLEDELGTKLFVRTNRKTMLTEDGIHMRMRAEEILSLVEQTESEIRDNSSELTGCLHIGAAETDAISYITGTFVQLQKLHPQLTFELFSGNIDSVEDRLSHGLLDFALIMGPRHLDSYDYIRLPHKIIMGLMVNRDHPLARKGSITPDDLRDLPLLIPSRSDKNGYDFRNWSGGTLLREQLHIVGKFDLINNVTGLIRAGHACALTINGLVPLELPDLVFIPLEPAYEITSYIIWKKYRLQSKAADYFIRELRKSIS